MNSTKYSQCPMKQGNCGLCFTSEASETHRERSCQVMALLGECCIGDMTLTDLTQVPWCSLPPFSC